MNEKIDIDKNLYKFKEKITLKFIKCLKKKEKKTAQKSEPNIL